jgi:hypothetical protein
MITSTDPSHSTLDLTFRRANNDAEDAERFCRLFNSCYDRKVDSAYYRWQFFEPPFPSVLALAVTPRGDLAGTYGFHVPRLEPGRLRIAKALDIMIAPSFRGRGVFRALAQFAASQVQVHDPALLCVFANRRAKAAHVQGLGWHLCHVFRTFCCPTGPQGGLGVLRYRQHRTLGRHFLASLSAELDLGLARTRHSARVLRWRFTRSPWYTYDLFAVAQRRQPVGYLALKTFQDPTTGEQCGDIVDLVCAGGQMEVLADMVRFALAHFHARGVLKAAIWLQPHTTLSEVGRDLGFVETSQEHYFCCRILEGLHQRLADPSRWLLTMADAEIY